MQNKIVTQRCRRRGRDGRNRSAQHFAANGAANRRSGHACADSRLDAGGRVCATIVVIVAVVAAAATHVVVVVEWRCC